MTNIPEMKIENNKIIEETMILDLVVNGVTEQVVLRKLSSGVQGRIRSACVKTRYLAGQPQVDINDAELEAQLLHAAIVSAPFPHDLVGVKNLPADVFGYITSKWSEFIAPTAVKKD